MQLKKVLSSFGRALSVATMLISATAPAQAESVQFEYKLKAVFLLNFAKFVQWPAEAFHSASAPLTICVVGEDPFNTVLDQVVQGETVQSHPLAVARPTAEKNNLQACHIAFFSRSMETQMGAILAKQGSPYTLTVGDNDSFTRQGGMINFILEETKVRFVVNAAAIEKASFTVSSKLLSLGRQATP